MSDAKKCDVCSSFYDKPPENEEYELKITRDDVSLDMCPDCRDKLKDFVYHHQMNKKREYHKHRGHYKKRVVAAVVGEYPPKIVDRMVQLREHGNTYVSIRHLLKEEFGLDISQKIMKNLINDRNPELESDVKKKKNRDNLESWKEKKDIDYLERKRKEDDYMEKARLEIEDLDSDDSSEKVTKKYAHKKHKCIVCHDNEVDEEGLMCSDCLDRLPGPNEHY